ncbi:uncharacterized protein F4812DRAFT_348047 [Daldinia caldariorum]|uniref:uncharacterized protein n=1 Tax=Daldinia caldariorum TaxID=326644 RepID=UPI00200808CE|nr:uncharacterized protein F4812DRAFT_348047 [Daldinia caldariorum]KAI1468824.1 hypothetical protein F4812DRAFT_348047 [Daldinia caldariorum]
MSEPILAQGRHHRNPIVSIVNSSQPSLLNNIFPWPKPGRTDLQAPSIRLTGNDANLGSSSQVTTPNQTYMDFLPSRRKISRQDITIGEETINKLNPVRRFIETLLLVELNRRHAKRRKPYKPISTRLAMMGTSTVDAQLHILIFCLRELKREVRRLVKKEDILHLYTPNSSIPNFEITVLGFEPRLCSSLIEVVTSLSEITRIAPWPIHGLPISFRGLNYGQRYATFGGVIMIITENDDVEFFGMTAGHMLHEDGYNLSTAGSDTTILENDRSTAQPSYLGDGIVDIDITQGYEPGEEADYGDSDDEYEIDSSSVDAYEEPQSFFENVENIVTLGQVVDPPQNGQVYNIRKHDDWDWALFRYTPLDKEDLRPKNEGSQPRADPLRVSPQRPGYTGEKRVVVFTGTSGRREGHILAESGRILLGVGRHFVETFMVTLSGSPGIRNGDSGSWVVDTESSIVYGQLVAVDALGDGYVIPMSDILNDMKLQFGAKYVGFPRSLDYIAPFNKRSYKENEGHPSNHLLDTPVIISQAGCHVAEHEVGKQRRYSTWNSNYSGFETNATLYGIDGKTVSGGSLETPWNKRVVLYDTATSPVLHSGKSPYIKEAPLDRSIAWSVSQSKDTSQSHPSEASKGVVSSARPSTGNNHQSIP